MKKAFLFFVTSVIMIGASAQSEKYTRAMKEKLPAVDSTRSIEGLQFLSASFERIGDAERTQWLPYYYAALTMINSGYFMMNNPDAAKIDPLADKAESLLNKAEELMKDNSEIFAVRKMIATLRYFVDPMNRYMKFKPLADQALATAKSLNPDNPRIYLLQGQDMFYTPEQYGGSKVEAKRLFEEALRKYDAFKPATEIDPQWGRGTTLYFIGQIK